MNAERSEPTFGIPAITSIANAANPITTKPSAPIKPTMIARPGIANAATAPTAVAAKQTPSKTIKNAAMTPTIWIA